VNHRPRLHGTSKYGISNRLWRGLHDVIGVQWLKTRLIRTQLRKDPP
jgi:dolichol-phosphate mannosyltransferase